EQAPARREQRKEMPDSGSRCRSVRCGQVLGNRNYRIFLRLPVPPFLLCRSLNTSIETGRSSGPSVYVSCFESEVSHTASSSLTGSETTCSPSTEIRKISFATLPITANGQSPASSFTRSRSSAEKLTTMREGDSPK